MLQASARSGCVHIVADVVRMPPQQLAPAADTAAEAAMAGRDPPGEPHGDAVGAGRSSSEGLYELLGGLVLQPGMAGSSSQWQGDGGGCRSDGTSAGGDQRISSRSGRAVLDLLQGLLGPRLGQKDTKPGSGSATHARPAGADYEQQVAAGRVELQLGSQVCMSSGPSACMSCLCAGACTCRALASSYLPCIWHVYALLAVAEWRMTCLTPA